MSVFPRRVGAGDLVVIHANLLGSMLGEAALHAEVRVSVVEPGGAVVHLLRRTVLTVPWPAVTTSHGDIEAAGGVRKALPLVVLASMLGAPGDRQRLLDVLENIQDGTHFYTAYPVSESSPPGLYRVQVEVRSAGRVIGSLTSTDDCFHVDALSAGIDADELVWVDNPGPEPVPLRLAHFGSRGELLESRLLTAPDGTRAAVHRLDPGSGGSVVLFYCEDRRSLPLTRADRNELQPPLRHPAVRLVERGANTFLVHLESGQAWQLDAAAGRAWSAADGFTPIDAADQQLVQSLAELGQLGLLVEAPSASTTMEVT